MATREELHQIARDAAREAVRNARNELQEMIDESFQKVGLDPESPVKIQRLFHSVEQLINNESIKGLMQSGLTAEDFRKLKELCNEGDVAQIVHNSREAQQYKKGLWNRVSLTVIGSMVLAGLGWLAGIFFRSGAGAPPFP